MKYTKTTYIDAQTGETHDLYAAKRRPVNAGLRKGGPFFMGYLHGMARIADARLTATESHTMFALLASVEWDNWLHVTASGMAEKMGRPIPNVSKAFQRLCDLGFIHKGPRVGRAYVYRMDPDIVVMGGQDSYSRIRKEIQENKWDNHPPK